ncbi:MAG TPA: protein kinase [Gemmataceae bacterium]
MSIRTGSDLLDALRRSGVLDAAQLDSLTRDALAAADPRALARELLRRDWLTPYQANQLLQGHGADLVLGPYLLLERLGAGGMGQVFKARHRHHGRTVALKVIRKERLSNPDAVRRFLREIRLAGQLSHPNVIVALDAHEIDGTYLLVMEHVEGVDLARLLKRQGPLPVAQACAYVRQAALGLQHAFERGLVHRDIKPSNLLVSTRDGSVKVLDLGLARQEHLTQEESSTLTEDGLVMGTPDYMAPEQIEESRTVDIRADIYSLGCTLYHLLAGRPPFPGESAAKKLARHLTSTPAAIESLRPDVPPGLGVVLRKMMAKHPEQRYATPAEVIVALTAALAAVPVAVPAASPALPMTAPSADPFTALSGADTEEGGRTSRQRRGRRSRVGLLSAAAAVAVLLGLGVLLWWGWHWRRPTTTPEKEKLSPLDVLSAEQIPEVERFASQPAELVAVLGNHGLRHEGETATVLGVACPPSGGLAASLSQSGVLCLWDLESGRERLRYSSPGRRSGLTFDCDGTRLAVTGTGIEVLSWNGVRLQRLFALDDKATFERATFSPDGDLLAAGGADTKLRVWDLRQAPPKATVLEGHTKAIARVVFTADSRTLFSCGDDGLVCRWQRDGQTWTKGATRRHEFPLRDLALSPDGRTLAVGSRTGWVSLWDLADNRDKPRLSFQIADQRCNALAFSPDGKTLAVAGGARVALWTDLDQKQPTEAAVLDGACSYVNAVAFTADGDFLVAGTSPNAVRLWRREGAAWRPHLPPRGHTNVVRGLSFSPDGNSLASVCLSRSLFVWPLTAAEFGSPRLLGGTNPVLSGPIHSPDGRTLGLGLAGNLQLWNPDGRGPTALRENLGQGVNVSGVSFAPDSRTVSAACTDGNVRVWLLDGPPPRTPQVIKASDKPLTAVALSPRGRKLAAAGHDGGVRLWTGAEGRWSPFGSALQHPKVVTAVLFTPDAETVITACDDGALRLWDVRSSKPRTPAALEPRHPSVIRAVALSPDGQTLASLDAEGRLMWWETTSWTKRGELRVPFAPRSLAFAPDGRHVATGNDNGTIYILRLAPRVPG